MIEQALTQYLNTVPAVIAALGGTKVYYSRAPKSVLMPYATIRNSGGMRNRLTWIYTDTDDTITIYVDVAENDQFRGIEIANAITDALENYRGDMLPERDLHIRCGSPRDLDGYQFSHRFVVTAYVKYKKLTTFPRT